MTKDLIPFNMSPPPLLMPLVAKPREQTASWLISVFLLPQVYEASHVQVFSKPLHAIKGLATQQGGIKLGTLWPASCPVDAVGMQP